MHPEGTHEFISLLNFRITFKVLWGLVPKFSMLEISQFYYHSRLFLHPQFLYIESFKTSRYRSYLEIRFSLFLEKVCAAIYKFQLPNIGDVLMNLERIIFHERFFESWCIIVIDSLQSSLMYSVIQLLSCLLWNIHINGNNQIASYKGLHE